MKKRLNDSYELRIQIIFMKL